MAGNGRKPNNELFELNELLTGVQPAEESLEDILAEVYGTKPVKPPEAPPPAPPEATPADAPQPEPAQKPLKRPVAVIPPVVRDDDDEQPDVLSDPAPKKHGLSKLVQFPGGKPQTEPPQAPDTPSAWVEPAGDELPPELLEAVFDDTGDARPDGFVPGKKPKARKLRQKAQPREDYRTKAEPEPEPQPEESRFSRWRAQADAFADSMFSQAATTDEDTEMAEKYIPGTDEEVPAQETPAPKLHRPRRVQPPPDDIPPQKLSHIFFTGLNFMSRRIPLLGLLTFVSAYLSIAANTGLPLPGLLRQTPALLAGVQLWLLGWAAVFSLDVIWMSFAGLRHGRMGLDTVASAAVIVTIIDAIVFCAAGRAGPDPYCAPATLLLLCYTWGAYDRKLANYRACRQAAFAQEPCRLTKDPALWNARDTFAKERGDTRYFGSQLQSASGADEMQSRVAPIILLAGVLFAFLASVAHGQPQRFVWCLSVILISAAPLSGLLCYGQPWLRLTRRLEKSGAAIAGWPGVRSAAGSGGVLITDADLFPTGSVQFNGIKVYGEISLEKLAGCAASLIRASGSGLTDLFDGLVRTQGGFYRRIDEFQCYEAGGLSGSIRGEQIMVGSAAFMTVMDVPLPQDLKVKNAVFCAIDGSLRGIFALSYAKSNTVRPAIQALLHTKLVPVLVPRDFNVTPAVVRQKLKVPVEKMEYPPVERRMELTEPEQTHSDTLCALLSRDTVGSYAETIVGCRRLRSAVRVSCVLSLIASVIGLMMGYYLTSAAAFSSLAPANVLAFLGLWLIPTLLLSSNVNRY